MTDTAIDDTVLRELETTTGTEFLQELISAFLSEAPVMIEDLKSAALAGDEDRFRRAAHSIKSNANVFGAHALAEHARNMEVSPLTPEKSADLAWMGNFDAEYARAEAALRALLDG